MNVAIIAVRILLGLGFLVFGFNFFFHFIPLPPKEGMAKQFMDLLEASGYMKVVKILEIAAALLVITGFYVPAGLVVLGAITVNIIIFHLVMDRKGLAPGVLCFALEAFLIYAYYPSFASVLTP